MEAFLAYCLSLFFVFFLLNYAGITAKPAAWLKKLLGPNLGYPLGCAFCWAWWTTLAAWWLVFVPGWFVFAAPVVHLFIDLAYSRLSPSDQVRVVTTQSTTLP